MAAPVSTLTRRELRAFPRNVADVVLKLMKDHGVRARMLDGTHVFLYGPDDSTIKVSRSRKPEVSVKIMNNWRDTFPNDVRTN